VKLKLDENPSEKAPARLAAAGHDVSKVPLKKPQAALDRELIQHWKCLVEGEVGRLDRLGARQRPERDVAEALRSPAGELRVKEAGETPMLAPVVL
jgi:hypothetical protein